MRGRHEQSPVRHRGLRWLAGAIGLGVSATILFTVSPADAAAQTVNAQLSLSGVASKDNPTGGSVLGIHPGDSVRFTASGAPTAGLDKLGLGGLVGGLLGSAADFQVTADFSHLPGGHSNTVLTGSRAAGFRFANIGKYGFTWTAQKIVVGLLGGKSLVPINLDGNQLKNAGIKLNAKNQYVGTVVVAKNPPAGGISVQLPSVQVAPSVPVVGQLPTVKVPGVRLPTLHTNLPTVGNLLPGTGSSASGGGTTKTKSAKGLNYTPPPLTVPEQIVPKGGGNSVFGGGGGVYSGVLPDSGGSQVGATGALPDSGSSSSKGSAAALAKQNSTGKNKTIDLASSTKSPTAQLPVILAIIAIITLAMVAGVYARLYLLRRPTD